MKTVQRFGCFHVSEWNEEGEWDALLQLAQKEESARINRFYHKIDAKRSLAGHLLIRHFLSTLLKQPFSKTILSRTKENKPYLPMVEQKKEFPNLNFNVAHAGDWVIVGLTTHAILGIDIEKIEKRPKDVYLTEFLKYLKDGFTEREWAQIHAINPHVTNAETDWMTCDLLKPDLQFKLLERFFCIWTLKESFIKAIGLGVGFELKRAEFRFKDFEKKKNESLLNLKPVLFIDGKECDLWNFGLFRIDDLHVAAVGFGPPFDPNITSSFKATLNGDIDESTYKTPSMNIEFEKLKMFDPKDVN